MNIRVLLIALAAAPAMLAAGPVPTPARVSDTGLQGATALALPSVVLVLQNVSGALYDTRDNTTHGPFSGAYQGTGFFVSADGYIVTAAHVAAPTPDLIKDELVDFDIDRTFNCDIEKAVDRCQGVEEQHHAEFVSATSLVNPNVDLRVMTQDMQPDAGGLGASVVTSVPTVEKDIAVLRVDGHNEPVSLLADATSVGVGSPLAVIGYPVSSQAQGPTLVPTITSGRVTGKRHGGDLLGQIATSADLLQVDAHTEHGNSGGPGVAADGSVIGIVSFGDTQNRNFLISSIDIAGVLATTPVLNQLGIVDSTYRGGLEAYQSGDYVTARQLFDQCSQINPNQIYCLDGASNAGAQHITAAQTTGPLTGIPPWAERTLWGLLGVVLGAGLMAIMARLRRKPAAAGGSGATYAPGFGQVSWAAAQHGYGMGPNGPGLAAAGVPAAPAAAVFPGVGYGQAYAGTQPAASPAPGNGHAGAGYTPAFDRPAAPEILRYTTVATAPPAPPSPPPLPAPDLANAGPTSASPAVWGGLGTVPAAPSVVSQAPPPFPASAVRAQSAGGQTMGI